MGVRAIRARIVCDRETLLALWRTHRAFNERLRGLIARLFAMRRGEIGADKQQRDLYKRVARFILARDSKDAPYLLNSVSIKGWKPATARKMKAKVQDDAGDEQEVAGESWAVEAAKLSAEGTLAFDKEAERDGLPDSVFQPLIRDAVAYVSGHDELVRNWEREHSERKDRRKVWKGATLRRVPDHGAAADVARMDGHEIHRVVRASRPSPRSRRGPDGWTQNTQGGTGVSPVTAEPTRPR